MGCESLTRDAESTYPRAFPDRDIHAQMDSCEGQTRAPERVSNSLTGQQRLCRIPVEQGGGGRAPCRRTPPWQEHARAWDAARSGTAPGLHSREARAELRVRAGVSVDEIQQTPALCCRRARQKDLPAKQGRYHPKEQIWVVSGAPSSSNDSGRP